MTAPPPVRAWALVLEDGRGEPTIWHIAWTRTGAECHVRPGSGSRVIPVTITPIEEPS